LQDQLRWEKKRSIRTTEAIADIDSQNRKSKAPTVMEYSRSYQDRIMPDVPFKDA